MWAALDQQPPEGHWCCHHHLPRSSRALQIEQLRLSDLKQSIDNEKNAFHTTNKKVSAEVSNNAVSVNQVSGQMRQSGAPSRQNGRAILVKGKRIQNGHAQQLQNQAQAHTDNIFSPRAMPATPDLTTSRISVSPKAARKESSLSIGPVSCTM